MRSKPTGKRTSIKKRARGPKAPPKRRPNAVLRNREWLEPTEVWVLIRGAMADKSRRHGLRDALIILVSFTHGLRVGELVDLRWRDFDLEIGILRVRRSKGGLTVTHPVPVRERRLLRRLQRQDRPPQVSHVFKSERGGPLSTRAVRHVVQALGQEHLDFSTLHPHMLRHSCGYKLANDGVDLRAIQVYLGHRRVESTTRYTELSPKRFEGFFA